LTTKCPKCGKIIVEKNYNRITDKNRIIKSRLIFLNDDGTVMGRCLECKTIISLPFIFSKSTIIDETCPYMVDV